MKIIGSTAMKHWWPEFPRNPKDVDVIEGQAVVNKSIWEKQFIEENKRVEWLKNPIMDDKLYNINYATPEELLTLKASHLFFDINFDKHCYDVQWMLEKGCKINVELFHELYKMFCVIHGGNKRSNLDMSSEEFFDNALKTEHSHDGLHELLIQHEYFEGQEKPTYTKILKEGKDVDVCMNKFNELTEKEKFNIVFEECAVMQFERYEKLQYRVGFSKMLKKFLQSHCKIEEAVWIIENYKMLLTTNVFNHIKFLKEKINERNN